jgi:hypothetical protein
MMERALQAIILSREPRSRATETVMPRRASSSGPVMLGVVCALLAAAAPGFVRSAQAECVLQPSQQAPEGAHWSLHFDSGKNRTCWILVDAAGHDLPTPEPQPAISTGLASIQSFLGNFTGGPLPPAPQEAPAVSAPTSKPQPHVVQRHGVRSHIVIVVNRPAQPVRIEQKADAQPAKHRLMQDMTQEEREAMFEKYLRWRESQKNSMMDEILRGRESQKTSGAPPR